MNHLSGEKMVKSGRGKQHKTLIGIVREHVDAWRKSQRWSRETVVQMIVEAHIRIGGEETTGIVFDGHTTDAFQRQKNNADRVYRWLDDVNKDNNLLPANFIPSILEALPADRRLHCAGEIAALFGFGVHSLNQEAGNFNPIEHTQNVIKESGDAEKALLDLATDQSSEKLHAAHKEVSEAENAANQARLAIEAQIAIAKVNVH